MVKKYVVLISIISVFITVAVFFKGGITIAKNNTGATILREQASKLSRGMTMSEVEQLIGEPTNNMGSGRYIPVYVFADGESLKLDYLPDSNNILMLMSARNKDGFDLLSKEYTAMVAEFPVLVNNEEIVTSNPVVTINDKIYIPLKELETHLGIKVEWSEEENTVKIATD